MKPFDEAECDVLVQEVENDSGNVFASFMETSTREKQKKTWDAIAVRMARATSLNRTGNQVWGKFKRMRQSAEKRQRNGEPLSCRELKILKICGNESAKRVLEDSESPLAQSPDTAGEYTVQV